MSTITLEPEPLPLDVKVVLFGAREIYYLLCAYDYEFLELFKVQADFDEEIDLNEQSSLLFAQLLKNLARKHSLRPLTKYAVIAVQEYAIRLCGDIKKISTHVLKLTDLLREADFFAEQSKEAVIQPAHIEEAISQQIYRASRLRDRQYELVERGTVLLNFAGKSVGQINGLSFYALGAFSYGHPVRITARVGVGNGHIVDIEREVSLGGPIHSKGVLILTGYINGHYARIEPISLSASLVFEQSYGGVEGDSATAAEACALLSAVADVPLKQNIAMTGSMNQHGEIQPIGGVNEKIEGFFDLCKLEGLSGDQGVIIPHSNLQNLMLRRDVVQACEEKLFNIYSMKHIEDALAILTGESAGERDHTGKFPVRSFNAKVDEALKAFAKRNMAKRTAARKKAKR